MNINPLSKNLQKAIPPILVLGLGGCQAYENYKTAPQGDKKNTLMRDIIILSGAAAGVAGCEVAAGKLFNKNFVNNIFGKIQSQNKIVNGLKEGSKNIADILKDCVEEGFVTIGAVLGGLISSFGAEKLFPLKDKVQNKDENNSQSPNYSIKENPDNLVEGVAKAYNGSGVKVAGVVDSPLAAMSAYNIAQQKGTENRLKSISYELIANAVIPTFIISSAVKATQNANGAVKAITYPIAALTGLFIGHHVGNYFNEEVTEEVVEDIQDGKFTAKEIKKNLIEKFWDKD